jgi:hypothetical protein
MANFWCNWTKSYIYINVSKAIYGVKLVKNALIDIILKLMLNPPVLLLRPVEKAYQLLMMIFKYLSFFLKL